MDLATRYWCKVDVRMPDECWPWTAGTNGVYGKIYNGERTAAGNPRAALAHRVGFVLVYGPIPVGFQVCHRCDFPLCQNPLDWFLGTAKNNNDDKIQKGRAIYSKAPRNRGERNPNMRLTDKQVIEIRQIYTGARGEQTQLAAAYGVSQPLISMIVNDKLRQR